MTVYSGQLLLPSESLMLLDISLISPEYTVMLGEWSREEDEKLLELVERLGKNWEVISKEMKRSSDRDFILW